MASGLKHEKSQVPRSCYPVRVSVSGGVSLPVWHPVIPIGNPVDESCRDVPEAVTVRVPPGCLLSWPHRGLVPEPTVSVDIRPHRLVESGDPVIDHEDGHIAACLVSKSPVRVLAEVVLAGQGLIDPGDVESRLIEESVAVIVEIYGRGVCVPCTRLRICITIDHPCVHAVVIEHEWPSVV